MSPEEVHTYFVGTVEPWELVGKRPTGHPQSDMGVRSTATHTLQILIAHKHHLYNNGCSSHVTDLRAAWNWFDCLVAVVLQS